MSFQNTFKLFLIVCLVGLVVWALDEHMNSTDRQRRLSTLVISAPLDAVYRLTVARTNLAVTFLRKDGTWRIEEPFPARANDGAVTRILHELEALPSDEIITARQWRERRLTLKDYGLDTPRARITLAHPLGREELLVGSDAPLGEAMYVRKGGSDAIIRTSRSLVDALPGRLDDVRDRQLVHGDPARTVRVEIQGRDSGFLQLMQTPDKRWLLQQPEVARADAEKITGMLQALYSLEILRFVADPQAAAARPAAALPTPATNEPAPARPEATPRVQATGLSDEEAGLRVTVWMEGDEVGRGVTFGTPLAESPGELHARTRDSESIYSVSKEIVGLFTVGVNDLKDRNLFTFEPDDVTQAVFREADHKVVLQRDTEAGWMIVEPGRWKADDQTVEDRVRQVTHLRVAAFAGTPTNLAAFGLAAPAYSVQLVPTRGVAAAGSTNRLLVGTAVDGHPGGYVKFDGEPAVYEIAAEFVKGPQPHPADPLVYRDRTMLAVSADAITRLSLVKAGVIQSVIRAETGAWTAVNPASNRVNQAAVDDVLFAVANLRALRTENHSPANVAAYGLDKPGLALTLGLRGEEGIQKTVLIGFLAGTDGLYAMIQGQDVVFVLDKALVDKLGRDLTQLPGLPDVKPAAVTK